MKTTLNLKDTLLDDVEVLAAQQRRSLAPPAEKNLKLGSHKASPARGLAKADMRDISVHQGHGGLMSGISATSNKALLDAIEDEIPDMTGPA